jgi:3-deoxy-D-arabino-heptulosonate 7-phosphate (DAHP) synthase class II
MSTYWDASEEGLVFEYFAKCFEAATGGQFCDEERPADPKRLQRVYVATGNFVSLIRAIADFHYLSSIERKFVKFDVSKWRVPGPPGRR